MDQNCGSDRFALSELTGPDLANAREALIDLTRIAAASGRVPGFAARGAETWVTWHWEEVIRQAEQLDVRVLVAREGASLVGTAQLRPLRAPGWGGWEPWRRLMIDNVIVSPRASAELGDALIEFALTRSVADFLLLNTTPGSQIQQAAERWGFKVAAMVADLLVGPDGAPQDGAVLTRSHAKPAAISPALLAQVEAVTPSVGGRVLYRPCEVVLKNGRMVDRVYVQEAWTWKQSWGVWPEDDRGKAALAIDDVAEIRESPSRLSAELATRLLEAGESGMGYLRFTLVLRDGRRCNALTGGAVDFPALPDGVTASDVVDVIPHEHAGEKVERAEDPPYRWCLYTLPESSSRID